jgi:hypothetical protein
VGGEKTFCRGLFRSEGEEERKKRNNNLIAL